MLTQHTRRALLVGAGATLLRTSTASAIVKAPLDKTYVRTDPPSVEVSYPEAWTLYTNFITDVEDPTELFTLTTVQLTPRPSVDGSGMPDLTGLGDSDALFVVLAEEATADEPLAPGLDVYQGVSFEDLEVVDEGNTIFTWRQQWYRGGAFGYYVWVWTGASADIATVEAVVDSFTVLQPH
jgi:hypothetical protein